MALFLRLPAWLTGFVCCACCQDCFVLLDLLGAALPAISNYQPSSKAEFRQLVSAEERLARAGFLPDIPAVFTYRESWGAWGAPQISDDHLPFLRRGELYVS